MDGRQEVDLGRRVHGAMGRVNVLRERHGQLRVEQLQPLLLGRQAEDLVLEALVLLLQGVERLEHLHNYKRQGRIDRHVFMSPQRHITKYTPPRSK